MFQLPCLLSTYILKRAGGKLARRLHFAWQLAYRRTDRRCWWRYKFSCTDNVSFHVLLVSEGSSPCPADHELTSALYRRGKHPRFHRGSRMRRSKGVCL